VFREGDEVCVYTATSSIPDERWTVGAQAVTLRAIQAGMIFFAWARLRRELVRAVKRECSTVAAMREERDSSPPRVSKRPRGVHQ
jgi:hypothetical protein